MAVSGFHRIWLKIYWTTQNRSLRLEIVLDSLKHKHMTRSRKHSNETCTARPACNQFSECPVHSLLSNSNNKFGKIMVVQKMRVFILAGRKVVILLGNSLHVLFGSCGTFTFFIRVCVTDIKRIFWRELSSTHECHMLIAYENLWRPSMGVIFLVMFVLRQWYFYDNGKKLVICK